MISETDQTHQTVKLFMRANPEPGCETQKQAVLERLDALESTGKIDSYEIHVWTKAIRLSGPLEGTAYYQNVFDHFVAFQEWANKQGVMLNSAFKIESVECEITDETYTMLSLPSICLAVYEDDELCAVYPHATDGQSQTASSCLQQLETLGQLGYAD